MSVRTSKYSHDEGTEVGPKKQKHPSDALPSTMYIVFVSLVLDLLAFTVILPLFPSLLEFYAHNDREGLYHTLLSWVRTFRDVVGTPDSPRWNSVLFGGLLGSLFSLLQYLTSPLFGAASDVYGRRFILIISLVGIACSYVVWALSRNFTIFVMARFIGGVSKGNISLCTAIATDVTTPTNRSRAMGMIGVAFSVGFLIGPIIGALFASYSRRSGQVFYLPPALFALIMATADVVFVFIFFKESLPPNKRAKSLTGIARQIEQLLNPVSLFCFNAIRTEKHTDKTALKHIGFTYFIYLLCFSGIEFTLTFLFHNRFQYTSMQQGMMFCFCGLIMSLTQGGYVRRMKAGDEKKTATLAMLVQLPSFVILAFAQNIVIMYVGLALYSFAAGTVVPCLTSLVSTYGQSDQKGAILGIFRSLGALSRALSPAIACSLYWSCGCEVCYMLGAAGLILPIYLLRNVPAGKVQV